jgi:hypothetical protein
MPDCPSCGGSTKCKWCSPRGTGKNNDGTPCKMCDGSGICQERTSKGAPCINGKVTQI